MKLKWRIVCVCSGVLTLSITAFVLQKYTSFPRQESFVPFEDELKANKDDFVDLDFFDSAHAAMQPLEDTHDLQEQHPQHLPPEDLPVQPMIHLLEGYGHSSLTPRMWCAVEAAARTNPQAWVTVHMRAPRLLLTPLATAVTATAPNLRVVTLDQERLFGESPLHRWYQEKTWETSYWPVSHFNDAIRWLLLYHYGGVYLDLDSLSMRAVTPPLFPHSGFAGMESHRWVGAGVISAPGPHHWLPRAALDNMANNFDGSEWGTNGPELLTKVLANRCGLLPPDHATPLCQNFTVLPPRAFYPVPWWEHHRYTDVDTNNKLSSSLLSDPAVRVIHIWQHLTKSVAISLIPDPKTSFREFLAEQRTDSRLREYDAIRAAFHEDSTLPNNVESFGDEEPIVSVDVERPSLQAVAAIAREVCPVTVALVGPYM